MSCNGNSCTRRHTITYSFYCVTIINNRTREQACSTRLELLDTVTSGNTTKTSFLLEKENAYGLFLLLFQTVQTELTSTATKYSLNVHCFAIKSDWDTRNKCSIDQDFSEGMKITTAWMKHSLLYRVVHISIYLEHACI